MLVTNGPKTISELRLFFAQLRILVGGAARSVRCRVEMWRGGVRQNISVPPLSSGGAQWLHHGSVSTSRSSNRTGRFPASGLYGALFIKGASRHFCRPLSFHSFVRPAPRAFFRPDRIFPSPSRAAAVKDGASSAPPKGLSLTDASTAVGCRRSGGWPRDDPRGACHWPRSIARSTLVFG